MTGLVLDLAATAAGNAVTNAAANATNALAPSAATDAVRWIWSGLNSNFGVALAGALAGAFGGAMAAGWISERTARRTRLLQDIRDTKAAMALTAHIVSTFAGLKRQHVIPVVRDFDGVKSRYEAHRVAVAAQGAAAGPFHFNPDLMTMAEPATPAPQLRDLVFRSSDPFSLAICQYLIQSIDACAQILAARSVLIDEMRVIPQAETDRLVRLFLGLQRPDGNTDARHTSTIDGLPKYTDDVIAFGSILLGQLAKHAQDVARTYGRGAPTTKTPNLDRLEKLGLIPDMAGYATIVAAMRGDDVDAPEVAPPVGAAPTAAQPAEPAP